MRKYAATLREQGFNITARWLHEVPIRGWTKTTKKERAEIDKHDVRISDVVVRFTDDLSQPLIPSTLATGSRHTEVGMALAWGIPVVVVGGHQAIFDYLSEVKHVKTFDALVRYLNKKRKTQKEK